VDLDGTLIKSDVLVESLLILLKRNPFFLLMVPLWLLHGKGYLKHQVSLRVQLDVARLPYNELFLEYLSQQQAAGRQIFLATACHEEQAGQIARHLGIFDGVLATSKDVNLAGEEKGRQLRTRFGDKGFDYAGNAVADLAVWRYARQGILIDPSRRLIGRAQSLTEIHRIFEGGKSTPLSLIRAMRIHQWLKNLLVFVPLVAAHRVDELPLLFQAGGAFLAFCLCASSVYLLNDLLDLNADRLHSSKRFRPLAAGDLLLQYGMLSAGVLLLAAFVLASWISIPFTIALAIYYLLTFAYSVRLKAVVMLDVMVLAGLYTIRVIAGAAAVSIPPSFWLLAFSMFLFLSLAMVKRHTELKSMQRSGLAGNERGYQLDDLNLVISLGGSSGYLSVLVLALYINSEAGSALYRHPQAIWLLCPLLLYWLSYVWLRTFRGEMHDDPLVFAVSDPVSLLLAAIGAVIFWMAI